MNCARHATLTVGKSLIAAWIRSKERIGALVIATSAPQPTTAPTPSGNNLGTTIFVLGLLAAAIVVTIALSLYARKLYRDR